MVFRKVAQILNQSFFKSSKDRGCRVSIGSLLQCCFPLENFLFWRWTSPAPSASVLQEGLQSLTILVALHWINCSLSMSLFYYNAPKWMQIQSESWGEEGNHFSHLLAVSMFVQPRVLVAPAAAVVPYWPVQLPFHLSPWGLFCAAGPPVLSLQGVFIFQALGRKTFAFCGSMTRLLLKLLRIFVVSPTHCPELTKLSSPIPSKGATTTEVSNSGHKSVKIEIIFAFLLYFYGK